jgi:hypothetical protein
MAANSVPEKDGVAAHVVHAVAAEGAARVSDGHVQQRALQVGPAAGTEVDVVPPRLGLAQWLAAIATVWFFARRYGGDWAALFAVALR